MAYIRISASAQSTSCFFSNMYFYTRFGVMQCLRISIYGYKVYTRNSGFNHSVNSCAPGATNTNHLNSRKSFNRRIYLRHIV